MWICQCLDIVGMICGNISTQIYNNTKKDLAISKHFNAEILKLYIQSKPKLNLYAEKKILKKIERGPMKLQDICIRL